MIDLGLELELGLLLLEVEITDGIDSNWLLLKIKNFIPIIEKSTLPQAG